MAAGLKTGGRTAGTANKSSRELKAFLERVFARAFTETAMLCKRDREGNIIDNRLVSMESLLVEQIITLTLDGRTLETLLAYWAGGKPKAIEHKHSGKVDLASIIAGTVGQDADDAGDGE